MGRLIDADDVIQTLKETGIIQDNDLGHLVVDEINRIPTAYDILKVVAELEEKAQDYHDRRVHHKTIGNLDNAVAFGHKEDAVRKSILIVRKGGVE